MSMDGQLLYKIGVIGPTRVGKTSLITSILKDSQSLLANTPLSMRPHGTPTEQRVARHRKELEGSLLAGEFNAGGLKGTEEPFTFELEINPGLPDLGIRLALLDYPGGWLDADRRPQGREKDWDECRNWFKESSVLLVPVDAAVLMEAAEGRHRKAVPWILTTTEVADVTREWAKERKLRPHEPALMLLCPLKCESYFSDNGGHRNAANQLLDEVRRVYGSLFEAVRSEASHIKIIYAPVDTIGCVEIIRANWTHDSKTPGEFEFSADYRVRQPSKQNVKGADAVLVSLCKHLVEAKRRVEADEAVDRQSEAQRAETYAQRNEGFFRNILYWLSGERRQRKEIANGKKREAAIAAERAEALGTVIGELANRGHGPRVHEL